MKFELILCILLTGLIAESICEGSAYRSINIHNEISADDQVIGVAQSDPVYPRDSTLVFENGVLVEATGHSVDLFRDLAYILHFRPIMMKGTGWGDKLPNGSWSGMSLQLLTKEADVCISQATFTAERAEIFTFLQPTYLGNYYAHFMQPPSRSLRNVFVQPFHSGVWLLLLLSSVLAILSLKIIYMIKYPSHKNSKKYPYLWDFTMGKYYERGKFSDLFLWIISCICQKGWPLTPEGLAMKIVFLTTILTTTIVYVAYTANLVAIFKTGDTPITEFATLRRQVNVLGDKNIPFISAILQNQRKRPNKAESNQEFIGLNEAVERVLTTRSAFLTVDGFFNAFLDTNRTAQEYCQKISTINALQTTRWAGMYIRRNWSKKEIFGQNIVKIIERGLNYRYSLNADRFISPHCNADPNSMSNNEEIQIGDVVTAFVLFTFGFVLSVAIFTVEYIGINFKPANVLMLMRSKIK